MAYKIIAYKSDVIDGKVVLSDSEDNSVSSNDPDVLLDFLSEEYTDRELGRYFEIKVAFDLDTFIAPVLSRLGMAACKQLGGEKHTYTYEHGSIFYIPGKIFSLTHKGIRAFIYHLAQYYEDEEEPKGILDIHAKAAILIDELKKMGLRPLSLTSPVHIYEKEVLAHCVCSTILDLPTSKSEEMIGWAESLCGRLWISAYQLGNWEIGDIYDYDLASAFPYQATKLYSLKYAKYDKSHFFPDNADWGFLRGRVTINRDVPVSPIIYRDDNGRLSERRGTFEDVITLDQYNFIKQWGVGSFELDQGWFIKFTAPVKPLEVPLTRLFGKRSLSDMTNKLAKRMAAGVYGKTIEMHDDGSVGKYYNPLYAALISTRTTLQVADFIYKYKLQDDLVHIGVDGILSTKQVPLPGIAKLGTGGMGHWKLKGIGPALVLSPGRVYTGDKHPQGLTYKSLTEMIEAHPNESFYSTKLRRRQTLAECVEVGSLKGLGDMKDTVSSLDINLLRTQQDRIFNDFPKTGGQLLNNKYKSHGG
jgi:hypothetical protein